MKKNPVVHFEMPYGDHARVAKFYVDVFGWKMNKMGEDMGNYIVAHTTETDEKQMVKKPARPESSGFFGSLIAERSQWNAGALFGDVDGNIVGLSRINQQ